MTFAGSASVAVVCLSLFLVWAAVTKLQNPVSTAEEFRQLGLPSPATRLVPIAELVVALTLVLLPGWGSVFAFFLLAAFTSILVTILRSGISQSCSCFGRTSRQPVGWFDIARNAVLISFSILGSTIDGLSAPNVADLVVIAGLTIGLAVYVLVSNPVQTAQIVAKRQTDGYKGR